MRAEAGGAVVLWHGMRKSYSDEVLDWDYTQVMRAGFIACSLIVGAGIAVGHSVEGAPSPRFSGLSDLTSTSFSLSPAEAKRLFAELERRQAKNGLGFILQPRPELIAGARWSIELKPKLSPGH